MAHEHQLDMAMRVVENEGLKGVACSLQWKSGGAEIALEDALGRIDQIIEDHISALSTGTDAEPQQATA